MISQEFLTIKKPFLAYIPYIEKYCPLYQINTNKRLAAFISNLAHESQEFTRTEENLNYSADRLAVVFPKRFASYDGSPNNKALDCAHNPVRLGNYIYANRMGNGDELSGDGYKHRGLGPLQITGKNNQTKCGLAIGYDLGNDPEILKQPEIGIQAACWFWDVNNLNDVDNFENLCDIINIGKPTKAVGDNHGYKHRLAYYNKLLTLLGD